MRTITITKLNGIVQAIFGEAYQLVSAKTEDQRAFYMFIGQFSHTAPDIIIIKYDWWAFEIAVADYIMDTYPKISAIMKHVPLNIFWPILEAIIKHSTEGNDLFN